jgi:hypothetical protein
MLKRVARGSLIVNHQNPHHTSFRRHGKKTARNPPTPAINHAARHVPGG